MIHTSFQRIQVWFGWCPNHPGPHVRTRDHMTGRVAPGITDPEPPRADTSKTIITVNHWMTGGALAILVATFFVGGNIWWPPFVLVILVIFVIIHLRTLKETGGCR